MIVDKSDPLGLQDGSDFLPRSLSAGPQPPIADFVKGFGHPARNKCYTRFWFERETLPDGPEAKRYARH